MKQKTVMSSGAINDAIEKIAAEIINSPEAAKDIILIGLVTRGVILAERIAKIISKAGVRVSAGALDITFYRDDVGSISKQPLAKQTRLPADITGRQVILVDDVLFTGRSIRAALDELMDFGRPSSIKLAVLVDRGHRELPIQADFIGAKIQTKSGDDIKVNLKEIDGKEEVVIK